MLLCAVMLSTNTGIDCVYAAEISENVPADAAKNSAEEPADETLLDENNDDETLPGHDEGMSENEETKEEPSTAEEVIPDEEEIQTQTVTSSVSDSYQYDIITTDVGFSSITITKYTGSESNLTIPGTIEGYPVTQINERAFSGCNTLTEVEIPDTVTWIGNGAFSYCTALEKINMPDSVTELGYMVFSYCTALKDIRLSKRLEKVDYSAFSNCTSLAEIEIPKNMRISQPSMSIFDNCSSLQTVKFEEGITKINANLLCNCNGLRTIEIPDTVTEIGYQAFKDCVNLSKVTLPKGLEKMGSGAFMGCSSLTSIELPKSLVDVVGSGSANTAVFKGCSSLRSVSFEEGTDKILDCLFAGCDGLETITIPETVTEIGDYAFMDCTSLKEIKIPGSVEKIGRYAFNGCVLFTSVEVPENVKKIDAGCFGNCTALSSAVIHAKDATLSNAVFEGCTALSSVTLPSELTEIGGTVFKGCKSLKQIALPQTLEKIYVRAFEGSGMTHIEFPENVEYLGPSVFLDCTDLSSVLLSYKLENIWNGCFSGCSSLTEISIPYYVSSIDSEAFKGCTSLQTVRMPRSVEKIEDNAFSNSELTILGVKGTYAETYAATKGYTFKEDNIHAEKIILPESVMIRRYGGTKKLYAKLVPSDCNDEIIWSSGNPDMAEVGEDGTVRTKNSDGDVIITASAGGSQASCKVSIMDGVSAVTVVPSAITLAAGESFTVKAIVDKSDAFDNKLRWSTDADYVANVVKIDNETAVITGRETGIGNTVNINASVEGHSDVYGSCRVTVIGTAVNAKTVSELESSHDYENGLNQVWIYKKEGARRLQVTFDERTALEQDHDFIEISYADGKETARYTGAELAGKTVVVSGDTVRIRLNSDDTGSAWGFKVTKVEQVEIPVCLVDFQMQGHGEAPAAQQVEQGEKVREPDSPAAEGFIFKGWYKDAACTEPWDFGKSIVESDMVLYAGWEKEVTYKVSFNLQDHGNALADYTGIRAGSLIQEPAAPQAEDYKFLGWYKDASCTERWNFAQDTVQKDTVLYAGWESTVTYTLSFDMQGYGTALPEYTGLRPGSLVKEPTVPQAGGYAFLGWYKDAAYTDKWDFSKDMVNADTILYAKWEKDETYDGVLWEDISAPDSKPDGIWVAGIKAAVYTGQAVTQEIRVYDGSRKLEEGLEYTVSYKNNKNTASGKKIPTVTVSGKGDYKKFKESYPFSINPVDISAENGVRVEDVVAVYTGKIQNKKIPTVTYNDKKLSNKKDFTVSYEGSGDYTKVGVYPITVKGIGNFTGTLTASLYITDGTPMSKAKVSKISKQNYRNGEEVKPDLTVKIGKNTLILGEDYTVAYENNREIGTAAAVITGNESKGYIGTKRVTFKITGNTLGKVKVTDIESCIYNGRSQNQDAMKVVLKKGGETLKKDKDYLVDYSKNKNAGKATITITGINSYSGIIKKTFKINAYELKEDDPRLGGLDAIIGIYDETGKIKAEPELTFDGRKLVKGKDYTLSYKNNKKAAPGKTAKEPQIIIKGRGNFKGRLVKTIIVQQ